MPLSWLIISWSPVYLLLAFHPENREAVQSCAGWWRALTHHHTLCTVEMCSQQQASAKPQIPPKVSAAPVLGSCSCVWPPLPGTCPRASPWPLLLGKTCLAFLPLLCERVKLCYSCALEGGECFWESGGAEHWWMPWETVLTVSLGEGEGLELLPGRAAQALVAAASKGGGRSRQLVNFRILCHRPKQVDVRMHCCRPWATIASSPCGCWQGGGHCWGCCHPTAVVSASIHPGLTAFKRRLHVVLIILGLYSALLFECGIWHRRRIGLDKAERGFDSWRSIDPTVLLLEEPLFGKRFHYICLV